MYSYCIVIECMHAWWWKVYIEKLCMYSNKWPFGKSSYTFCLVAMNLSIYIATPSATTGHQSIASSAPAIVIPLTITTSTTTTAPTITPATPAKSSSTGNDILYVASYSL